jgi:CRISPR/Cas system Type II protein with McrA/HNH and RuvC-like nuclease domain
MRRRRAAITKAIRREIWDRTAGKCWYCGDVVNAEKVYTNRQNIDHKEPVSKGGWDAIDNLVLACYACNAAKWIRTLQEFREHVGREWAWSFELAAKQLAELQQIWGPDFGRGGNVLLRDVAAFCERANFLFHGETLGRPESENYQI